MASGFQQDDVHQNLVLQRGLWKKYWRWLMWFMMSDTAIRPTDQPLT